jgi:hypothetical protein
MPTRFADGIQVDGSAIVPNITVSTATSEAVNAESLKGYVPAGSQVPAGGTTGQVLAKTSNADYEDAWVDVPIRREAKLILTDAATVTWNVLASRNAQVTLAGNRTLSISNVVDGDYGTLLVIQDATAGRTLTLPTGSWVAGIGQTTACPIKTTANARSIVAWWYDGTTYYFNVATY